MHTVGTLILDAVELPSDGLDVMINQYASLLQQGVVDLDKWQAVHRKRLIVAPTALVAAVQFVDKTALAELIYQLTESPAQLFARLGDGVDYYESEKVAVFASRISANVFQVRFPDWGVGSFQADNSVTGAK